MPVSRSDLLRELELMPFWRLRQNPALAMSVVQTQAGPAPAQPAGTPSLPKVEVATPMTGADSWDALEAEIRACARCALHAGRTHGVPGVGDRQADWLIVGEAPGAEEDKRGEPFVGQAGKLLDAMLAAIRLQRGANVYIANVLKSRPPANRDPAPDEVAACLPYLQRQIALIQPKIILALGRFAAQSLLNTDTPIGKLRGCVHLYQGVPLVVTYHPAYLLRNAADKSKAWEDLLLAARTFRGG
jgi:DNA polymerase